MKQFTLDNWLKIKNKKFNIKKYFYIDWTSEFIPEKPIWCDEKPDNINFIQEVKWQKNNTNFVFYICGFFNNINMGYTIRKEQKYKNTAYLKSHLQKCVRLMEDTLAIKTAYHFIKNNFNQFLRRLPIITIEDTILIEEFNIVIWLMVASNYKKFKIKKYIIEWLLGYVCVLSNLEVKDEINNREILCLNLKDKLESYNKLKDRYINTLYCLSLRKCYGGMKGDMNMIDYNIDEWYNRFTKNKIPQQFYRKVKPVSLELEILSLDDWILTAIDFHCYSGILDILNKRFPSISKSEIKKLIWHNSSKINKRTNNEKYNYSLFIKIKNDLIHLQRYLLNCYY